MYVGRCCLECFDHDYLKKLIKSTGTIGECEFCGTQNMLSIDTSALTEHFRKLMDMYEVTEYGEHYFGPDSNAEDYGDLLHKIIQQDWQIFRDDLDEDIQSELLWCILDFSCDPGDPDIIDPSSFYTRYEDALTYVDVEDVWEEFCEEIKYKNRYIRDPDWINSLNGELQKYQIELDVAHILFRARLGADKVDNKNIAYKITEMGMPPIEKTKNNRANPIGIRYLYTATSVETAIAEVRPWKSALISIAHLEVVSKLSLVNLTSIPYMENPFEYQDIKQEVEIRSLLRKLSSQMAEPIDPGSEDIEYIPTQYLSELIKQFGFDGIMFRSSLGKEVNVVLFNESKVKFLGVSLYRVSNIHHQYEFA